MKDDFNIGKEINESLQNAIKSGDFSNLSKKIEETIGTTVNEFMNEKMKSQSFSEHIMYSSENRNNIQRKNYNNNYNNKREVANQTIFEKPFRARFVNKKSFAGNMQRVFGWIGAVLFTPQAISTITNSFSATDVGFLLGSTQSIVTFALVALSVLGIVVGNRNIGKLNKAKNYYKYFKDRQYINVSELETILGIPQAQIRTDLEEIIRLGMLPDANFNKERNCLILNHRIYLDYVKLESQREKLLLEEKMEKAELSESEVALSLTEEQKKEWISVISEGEEYIKKLKKLNDDIPGEIISQKLDNLEKLLNEIFARLRIKPEESNQMKKFMEYYLPTTVKLVDKYREFDAISFPSKEVLDAKLEIERAFETINHAFKEMLNNLFKNDIYDVTSDAQVLKTMLAKEGLTIDEISSAKNNS